MNRLFITGGLLLMLLLGGCLEENRLSTSNGLLQAHINKFAITGNLGNLQANTEGLSDNKQQAALDDDDELVAGYSSREHGMHRHQQQEDPEVEPGIVTDFQGGTFVVHWEVTSTDPYFTRLYLSEDDELGAEEVFLEQTCGSLNGGYNCNQFANFNCRISSELNINCKLRGETESVKNIAPLLDQLPKQTQIVLEACDSSRKYCATAALPVSLY